MSVSNQIKNLHLLWRSGFGISNNDITTINTIKPKDIATKLFTASKDVAIDFIDVASDELKKMKADVEATKGMDLLEKMQEKLGKEQRREIAKLSRQDIKMLNQKWLAIMVNSKDALREKVALFWHGHFACRIDNIFHHQQLLHIIRTNALGNFGDLLKAVSKSAAMLSFLNNQQNKKQHANENFAREVMELFTLGRGNYSEQDVKNAAKAFTGWGFDVSGNFVFRRMQHDDSSKTILGKTGYFNGDDVLDILLEQQQTAKFITTKVYKFFVSDDVDTAKVDWLSKRFYNSKYNIESLLKDIFFSDWFYDEKIIGCKIKSPIELLVGIQKQLPMQLDNPEVLLLLQKVLGQVLFYPPNVAGWAGGKNWIDSSSLMVRLQIPRIIKDNDEMAINTKPDDDQQMGMKEMMIKKTENVGSNKFKISAQVNWESYIANFESIKRENLLDVIKSITILNSSTLNSNLIENNIDSSSRENFIKSVTIVCMGTPEYQMC